MQTPQFGGFQPSGKAKIAQAMGFQGPMEQFDQFLQDNPDRKTEMMKYEDIAKKMVSGGYVAKMQEGGDATKKTPSITDVTIDRITQPALPAGAITTAYGVPTDETQTIAEGTGSVGDMPQPAPTSKATATQYATTQAIPTPTPVDADQSAEKIAGALSSIDVAKVDPDDPKAKVNAAQQTVSAVSDLESAQGNATKLENPIQRQIQDGELISGAADAEKAAKFTEQIQAAEATPSKQATTQGQLETLMQQFEGGNTPPWAAGALRNVQAAMAKRGLGASSMAAQAMMQAALESALPIAQADAQTIASFEAQNLSNNQQRAMLAAQQRATFMGMEFDQQFQARVQNAAKISDIANMNFTAEQNIALENSRAANTMNMANLNNSQAMVMAEAAALSQLDMSNLNNRQQAAVQNAQTFLQRDMANLSNEQQTALFKGQQISQSIFTDQAATNAARQFNATSQNQSDQFFANLASQNAQFNASQANAISQFNAGQENAMSQFNSEMNNQRDQFDAKNALIIAQNNAQWRREIATADTAAINRANELNANAVLGISNQAYANLWSYYSDTMEWAWQSAENSLERQNNMAVAELDAKTQEAVAKNQAKSAAGTAIGKLIGSLGNAWITAKYSRT